MGKYKKGILGKFKGTIASVIGSVWRGIPYMRSVSDDHKDAKTEKQVAQRTRFGACTKFTSLVKNDIILPIWEKRAVRMTGVNLFVKTNQHCFNETGNISNYQNMVFSLGKLPLPESIVVQNNLTGNGAIQITWTDNSGTASAIATDQLALVALTGETPVVMSRLTFTRNLGNASIQLPYTSGETVNLYIFFRDPAGENYSPSFYASLTISGTPTT
jgi:hypothetical protein